ncbi:MAG: efflux RND transporter permease subunit, partial [Desulfatitalea sp.]|nr:efflux RND transporter permease subunit [Desulfatitalea sp.]NNJ99292.1 efflux RND transporter permease subunit [Desulfatitalea sp.]
MTENKLKLTGLFANFFVTARLTVLLILACLLFGLLAIIKTPREENPQIIIPGASVQVLLPGASAEEVEALVIRPLEGIVKQIPGVDHTYATAMNSMGMLAVQFKVKQDKEKSLVDLYDRVLGERNRLPAEAADPVIRSAEVDDVPIVTITLASEKYDDYALKRLADRLMEGLRSLEDVSTTYIKGGRDREIRIEVDPKRLQAYGVTLDQVRALITAANVSAPLGTFVAQGRNQNVFLDGYVVATEDLKQLIVGNHAGRPIYLGDVAQVVDGPPEEITQLTRIGFGQADGRFGRSSLNEWPAVTLAVAKKKGSNAVFTANEVLARIERMRRQFVPSQVELIVTRNDGRKANDSVNQLIEHIGISLIAVCLVAILFLGVKEALIIALSIPLILSVTLGVNYIWGPTINRVTLFGLILSLGLLVDAAIIVIENIQRNFSLTGNGDRRRIAVAATNEIGNPTNLATIAIILVFMSMNVISGVAGQFFYPVAFTVPVAMAASLLVAYS